MTDGGGPGALRAWLKIAGFLLVLVAALFVAQQLGDRLHRREPSTHRAP